MTSYEIYAMDQVTWSGRTYERYLLGSGGPEYGLLNFDGSWFQYSRDWFKPPLITPYMGTIEFNDGNVIMTPYHKDESSD